MNIIIYNINSFGGNYEYSKYLFQAYSNHPDIKNCKLLMPDNADVSGKGILKILINDAPKFSFKPVRKLHYIYRSLINPFRLLQFISRQTPSVILFNDFDQVTALLWAPFFHLFKRKHFFAVILHDPDRDGFFSIKKLSELTMGSIMSFMKVAFYHGFLPEKKYYAGNFLKLAVPHGIYDDTAINGKYLEYLKGISKSNILIGVLGNIRPEKNYENIIDSLVLTNDIMLLVAGSPSNSAVSVDTYKKYAVEKGVSHKIIWEVDYLDQPSFNSAITACDIVLLYYKPSFTSQSGVLNSIALFMKKLIVSDTGSSLCQTVQKFNLGEVVAYDQPEKLVKAIYRLRPVTQDVINKNWNSYIKEASWDKHVSIAMEEYKNLMQ